MPEAPTTWVIRAGRRTENAAAFLRLGVVAVGFGVDELCRHKTLADVRQARLLNYPHASASKAASQVGQAHRFANVVQVNDQVLTYDSDKRTYHIGRITGPTRWDPNLIGGTQPVGNIRDVVWSGEVSRDDLSPATRNSLGSISTIFRPSDEACEEVRRRAAGVAPPESPPAGAGGDEEKSAASQEAEELVELRDDIAERAHEFLKDELVKLDWEQMQELVAAVLRAMGYKTRVSPRGSDRGKDIVASPDGLGLEPPRIKVEVKHRQKAMGAPEIRGFLGGLRRDDRGLYVSTGGFTTEAAYEAERAEVPITLLDLDDLAELIRQHYESMDGDGRALVPLQRIYWPIR